MDAAKDNLHAAIHLKSKKQILILFTIQVPLGSMTCQGK